MRRWAAIFFVLVAVATVSAQPPTIADFFDRFTADWIRSSPDQATSTRYFSGEEQRNLERQLTPVTEAWAKSRRDLARRGLAELSRFDLSRVNKTDRLSAELMRWQLQVVVDGERFADYAFPFDQFQGVNVNLPNAFTVVHPLLTEADGENYIARLQQMPIRLDEAVAEGQRIATKGFVPPRFILNLTIAQMKQFADQPAARNPLVTTLSDKLALVKTVPDGRREALRPEAERIVADQIYPAWRRAIAFLEPLVSRVNDDAGLWRLNGGAEAYAYN